ncbi:MAG TPA: DUF6261 family protein [Bacteroidales bacterium]|jgi:hypothetical protein|nr:DUF6261 family protein [Bacteroidales bacterium]
MKNLIVYPLQKLRNDEFPDVVDFTLDIVEKHNPVELKIEGFYNRLLEKRPLLEEFSEDSNLAPQKELIDSERKERWQVILAIKQHANAAEKAAIGTQSDARMKVFPLVNNHLSDLTSKNQKVINRAVVDFLREYDDNAELIPAATLLGIDVYIDKLKTLQQSFNANIAARRKSISAKRSVKLQDIKLELVNTIGKLFSAIEVAQDENPAIDYTPLINELGELMVTYRALVKGRSTRAKTSADKNAMTAELSSKTTPAAI